MVLKQTATKLVWLLRDSFAAILAGLCRVRHSAVAGGSSQERCVIHARLLTVLHHDLQELDNHFGRGSDQDLSLATLLCVVHGLEGIVQHADAHHLANCPLQLLVQRAVPKETRLRAAVSHYELYCKR